MLDTVGNLVGHNIKHMSIRKYLLDREYGLADIPNNLKCEEFFEEHTFLVTCKPD